MYGEIPALERELAEAAAPPRATAGPTGAGSRPPGSVRRPSPWSRRKWARTTSRTWSPPGPASRPAACWRARPASCSGWRPSSAGGSSARPGPSRRSRTRSAGRGPASPTRIARRLVPVPRAYRGRQDGAGQGARRVPLRRRAGDHPDRHERVLRAPFGRPAGRRAARLCRLRRRRPAHRGGPAAAVLRRAARRGGEGSPGGLRHPAAGAR
jgi:hypothetical protein